MATNNTRSYRIQLTEKKTGNITYTTITVESPAGSETARKLAESMYGSTHRISVLA